MSQFRGVAGFPGAVVITPMTDVEVPLTVTDVNGTTKFTVDKAGALAPSGNLTVAASKTLAVTTADKLTVGGVIVGTGEPVTFSAPIATGAINQSCFVADAAYQVTGVNVVWGVASTSGTFAIEKLTGTTAPGSGTTMLTGTVNTAGTANTVTAGALTGTVGTLQLAAGDRIGAVFTGTQTNLVGLMVVISLKRI